MIDVHAVDVKGVGRRRARRLLADSVDVSFKVVMPVTPGAEQSTFDSVAADLTAAAADGGAIATSGGLDSLGGTLDTTVPPSIPAALTTVDSSDSCVGPNVVLKPAPPSGNTSSTGNTTKFQMISNFALILTNNTLDKLPQVVHRRASVKITTWATLCGTLRLPVTRTSSALSWSVQRGRSV